MPRPPNCTIPGWCVCEPFAPGACRWRVDREAAAREATAAMAPMLREIREVMYLPDDNPRRQAAITEKLRVLELIERSKQR